MVQISTGPVVFLSTLSLRRATMAYVSCMFPWIFLSTLSLRRATLEIISIVDCRPDISIHALLAESDPLRFFRDFFNQRFLSTLSLRRATTNVAQWAVQLGFLSTLSLRRATTDQPPNFPCVQIISIHALLAESDLICFPMMSKKEYFYPRSPCGERRSCHRHKQRR